MRCLKCGGEIIEIRGGHYCSQCGEKVDLSQLKQKLQEEIVSTKTESPVNEKTEKLKEPEPFSAPPVSTPSTPSTPSFVSNKEEAKLPPSSSSEPIPVSLPNKETPQPMITNKIDDLIGSIHESSSQETSEPSLGEKSSQTENHSQRVKNISSSLNIRILLSIIVVLNILVVLGIIYFFFLK